MFSLCTSTIRSDTGTSSFTSPLFRIVFVIALQSLRSMILYKNVNTMKNKIKKILKLGGILSPSYNQCFSGPKATAVSPHIRSCNLHLDVLISAVYFDGPLVPAFTQQYNTYIVLHAIYMLLRFSEVDDCDRLNLF